MGTVDFVASATTVLPLPGPQGDIPALREELDFAQAEAEAARDETREMRNECAEAIAAAIQATWDEARRERTQLTVAAGRAAEAVAHYEACLAAAQSREGAEQEQAKMEAAEVRRCEAALTEASRGNHVGFAELGHDYLPTGWVRDREGRVHNAQGRFVSVQGIDEQARIAQQRFAVAYGGEARYAGQVREDALELHQQLAQLEQEHGQRTHAANVSYAQTEQLRAASAEEHERARYVGLEEVLQLEAQLSAARRHEAHMAAAAAPAPMAVDREGPERYFSVTPTGRDPERYFSATPTGRDPEHYFPVTPTGMRDPAPYTQALPVGMGRPVRSMQAFQTGGSPERYVQDLPSGMGGPERYTQDSQTGRGPERYTQDLPVRIRRECWCA